MMTIAMLTVALTTTMLALDKNPMKWCLALVMMSVSVFSSMIVNSSSGLLPMILLLMFLGGIIMMFMILSSTMPNEKSSKSKINKATLTSLALLITLNYPLSETSQEYHNIKWFNIGSANILVVMVLMSVYFMLINMILSNSFSSMRLLLC